MKHSALIKHWTLKTSLPFPHEFLHTITPDGLPPHKLRLKVGMPVMLVRNLHQPGGKANGTIAVIQHIRTHVLQAKSINGSHKGRSVNIPRIKLISRGSDWPFQLTQRQVPVRPAFATTINKAKGQTLEYMGLYLPKPVFYMVSFMLHCHESAARIASPSWWWMGKSKNCPALYTKNIVFRQVFH